MTFNKKALAGLVALAAAGTAQSATLVANDGWEVSIGGFINQFAVFTENDNGEDIQEVRDGLLPAFINFDVKAPTMNGLDIAAHISFQPGTNVDSYGATNATINDEQREVYFTVDGSFGQILMGKALGLYGSHNILTEQTIWGVGYGTGANGVTTLGGIGLGYDYASWRSQIRWTSPDMNGFKLALAVVDGTSGAITLSGKPTGSIISGDGDRDDFRYEADLSYAGTFDGGSFSAWLSAAVQDHDDGPEDARYWTVGGTLTLGGFEFMAQYSDAEDSVDTTNVASALWALNPGVSGEAEWSQYVVQAGYRFGGSTLVSVNYSELEDDSSAADRALRYTNANDDTIERLTVGVYHDVNANLKLVAEYTNVEDDDDAGLDQDIYSIGGFVFF